MLKKIGLVNGKKKIEIEVNNCNWWNKFRGLMFRRRENAPILLFEFGKPTRIILHSLFVFFPFYVLWLDRKNNILEIVKAKPWRISIAVDKKFNKIVEVPINTRHRRVIAEILKITDEKERFKY